MKRIKCQCGTPAVMESELWPSIRLCHECYKSTAEFFATKMPEVLDGNPLAMDICGLELHGDRYRIWIINDSYVCKEFYFRSRKMTLDISNEL